MAISYNMTVKNARLQAVIDAIGTDGVLVIGTDALSGVNGILVSIPLQSPAFTTPINGSMSLVGVPLAAASHQIGIATKAEIRTSTGTTIVSGFTVGIDIILSISNIEIGTIVSVTSGVINHA